MKVDELSKKVIGPYQMDVKEAGAVFRGIIALILWLISEAQLNTVGFAHSLLSSAYGRRASSYPSDGVCRWRHKHHV